MALVGSLSRLFWKWMPSVARRRSFSARAGPDILPWKPPGVRSEAMTRWQGTSGANGLARRAWPMARGDRQRSRQANAA